MGVTNGFFLKKLAWQWGLASIYGYENKRIMFGHRQTITYSFNVWLIMPIWGYTEIIQTDGHVTSLHSENNVFKALITLVYQLHRLCYTPPRVWNKEKQNILENLRKIHTFQLPKLTLCDCGNVCTMSDLIVSKISCSVVKEINVH